MSSHFAVLASCLCLAVSSGCGDHSPSSQATPALTPGVSSPTTATRGTRPPPPSLGAWTDLAAPRLLQPLSGAACAAYNGELFLFGGELSSGVFSDRIHRYDPAQGTVVEELAILPTTILGSGRAHAAAVTVGTSIWVFGGSTVGGPSGGPYAELMEFVPQIGALFTQGFLPEARFGLAAAAVGSKVYLLGGSTLDFSVQPPKFLPKTQIWEFDTVARTFRTMTSVLPQALVFARAVTVGGKVYVVGGSDGETTVVTGFPHTTPALSDQLYVFDPTTDTITAAAPLPSGRQALVVAEVNGQIYAISGDTTTGLHDATAPWSYFTSETLTYDPAVDAWRVLRPIVTTLGGRSHAGGAAAGGRIYVLGGYTLPAAGVAVPPIPATQGRSDLISFFQP